MGMYSESDVVDILVERVVRCMTFDLNVAIERWATANSVQWAV